ncbi:MAG: toluene monooxygenase system protein B [Gammaproteobacteria bacterium]|jgi:toluene monooxygenase system protein B
MAAFPIHSNFQGDFVLQLVEIDTDDSMDAVAEKCAYHSVGRRVAPQPEKVMRVRHHESKEVYPRDMKVSEANWRLTEAIDVIFADE